MYNETGPPGRLPKVIPLPVCEQLDGAGIVLVLRIMLKGFLPLIAVSCLGLTGCDAGERPSFILLVADTLRADYLGSYGFRADISPNLDELADEAVSFDSCVAPAPWTKPSIATLFTSLHPRVHGVTNHKGQFWGGNTSEMRTGVLPDSVVTLAEALRSAGYRTGAMVGNPWMLQTFGFAQGFDEYDGRDAGLDSDGIGLLARARSWLEGSEVEPFFLYLHLMEVHGPYEAPAEDLAALRGAEGLAPRRRLTPAELVVMPEWFRPVHPEDAEAAESLDYWRVRYGAGVRLFDRRFGELLGWLRQRGFLDRTWILVTSDHGEALAEHGLWGHGKSLFEHQIRVPLIVRPPGTGQGGRRVSRVVGLIDLAPTILSLAGVEAPRSFQGRDVSGLLVGPEPTEDRAEARVSTSAKFAPSLYAVRTERYKLIVDLDRRTRQLFDLAEDPGERWNLAKSRPDLVRELEEILHDHRENAAALRTLPAESAPVSSETAKSLEALGYLE